MNLSIIAAIGNKNELGAKNKMLWHIPADLKRFKSITSGHTVVMGRKTFESIDSKPLPNRKNLILTQRIYNQPKDFLVVHDLFSMFQLLDEEDETFILGGGEIFKMLLPYCNKMYLTLVHKIYPEADVFFPDFNPSLWQITERIDVVDDVKAGVDYSFVNYSRKRE